MQEGSKKILKGAFSLGMGSFLAKLLGAVYRIPLTNMLGGAGLGLYQMVFPIYCVLLDFSGAGVPSALSKIIASSGSENQLAVAKSYLKVSIKLFFIFGLICSAFMAVFSKTLATAQGNPEATLSYVALSPAILLVSLISCFRGYFQGLMRMSPTAVSQVIEQVIKLGFGLLFASFFLPSIPKAVAGATLAISFSELIALIYLYLKYKLYNRKNVVNVLVVEDAFISAKKIIKIAFPVTLIGVIIPLSHVIDSFMIINILSKYREDATALYGLLGGVALTVINLPVSICYGIATVTIPTVSGAKDEIEKNRNAKKTLILTLLASVPCAVFLLVFSPFTVNLLFRRLSSFEKDIAENLIRICSPCVIFLSVLQTTNAILVGKGKTYLPIISLSVGVGIKTVANAILLKNTWLNIYGGAIALIACYFTVSLVNLILIFSSKVKYADKRACDRQYAS